MRDWTLTPLMIVTLLGSLPAATFAGTLPEPANHGLDDSDFTLGQAGWRLIQRGPVRRLDRSALFHLSHRSGPAPRAVRYWLGDDAAGESAPKQAPIAALAHTGVLIGVDLPRDHHVLDLGLWLESEDTEGRLQRARFGLLR